ncbi:hypothetical protein AGR3A_Lc10057 [Agrobacterium tomkonis CFBP 6623]|uniref:Uncharacterized protein n=1 Tax=Agrobacterium tomkonis CFBP 6623 TaxID=1183432 RepID=A0A1S7QTL4_9HYPH|nr:hypothetical protein AGR3A_Lc10057 [Agrobacterium tomkonis CFBP 6623]
MGPPKEVTPSFRKAAKTSPGVPFFWLSASAGIACVDGFTKSSLSVQRLFVNTNGYQKNHVGIRHYCDRDMKGPVMSTPESR